METDLFPANKFILDIEYSVIMSDAIKSFDCTSPNENFEYSYPLNIMVKILVKHFIDSVNTVHSDRISYTLISMELSIWFFKGFSVKVSIKIIYFCP